MTGIITSRRSFLHLFGATILAATLPAQQLAVLASEIVKEQTLPPNVLHVLQGSKWEALGELLSIGHEFDNIEVPVISSGGIRKFRGTRDLGRIEVSTLYIPELRNVWVPLILDDNKYKFAISLSGVAYEFGALVVSLQEQIVLGDRFHSRLKTIESSLLVTSAIEMRNLE